MSSPCATELNSTIQIADWQVPKGGYGFLEYALAVSESLPKVRAMFDAIIKARRNTRPGYPPRIMWRLFCLKFLLTETYNLSLIERLRSSPRLREICGLDDQVPSEPTVSRFFRRMAEDFPGLGEAFIVAMVNRLKRRLPDDAATIVAVDSSDLPSYANGFRPEEERRDPEAAWGHRTRKNVSKSEGASDDEMFYGRKLHSLTDVVYGIPLCNIVLPANESDSPVLRLLVEKAKRLYPWFKPKYLLADRGYDGQENFSYLVKEGIEPIIHVRKPTAHDGLYEGLFDRRGRPVCGDGKALMQFIRSEGSKHLFRCAEGGCSLRSKSSGSMQYCGVSEDTWIDVSRSPKSLRAFGWKVLRSSSEWKELYRLRQVIERFFSSAKRSRLLDVNRYFRSDKIELHVDLSVLNYLTTMETHMAANDPERIRFMRIRVRSG